MLAIELFLRNKYSNKRIVREWFPIKKIFLDSQGNIKLDENSLNYYSSTIENYFLELQTILSAPLNDSNNERINLPDQSRGGNSYSNFVKLLGTFTIKYKNNMVNDITIKLTTAKPNSFSATLNSKNKRVYKADGKLSLKLKLDEYYIDYYIDGQCREQTLLKAYQKSKILDENLSLDSEVFKKICNTIFDSLYPKICNFIATKKNISRKFDISRKFEIYILPNENRISIHKIKSNISFIDSFGNCGTGFSNETTLTVSFFSCDDPAFTINLVDYHHRYLFYKNLGISIESLEKVEFRLSDELKIRGLSWFFFDIRRNDFQFVSSVGGIFKRLYENYHYLKNNIGDLKDLVQMKVICLKRDQNKIHNKMDLLIDENMTMDRMEEIFENEFIKDIVNTSNNYRLFEVLIEEIEKNKANKKKKNFYGQYIMAVRSLITGNQLDKFQLINYLTKLVKKQIHKEKWLEENFNQGVDFFNRSWICLKILFIRHSKNNFMDAAEEYAYNIGLIAGKYVKYREQEQNSPKSLREILTYTKYDRDKLRYVYSKICLGVNLSNLEGDKMDFY